MIAYSSIFLNKEGYTEDILTSFWNNLARTMAIMDGSTNLPPTVNVSSVDTPLQYRTYNFVLTLFDAPSSVAVKFNYGDTLKRDRGENLNTAVAMTSALEYVIGRTGCLEIEEWNVFYGTTKKSNQDISIDSMADVLDSTKDYATALFEDRVATKLDEIERVCL